MRAQITLFVIVAILIVSAVGISYYLISSASQAALNREQTIISAVTETFRPAETNFISCLKTKAQDSLTILGSQAGYINLPAEDPASDYMPFSNTADMLGLKIPYWWYISGNNIQKNQVPSLEFMQNELQEYMDANIHDCDDSLRLLSGYQLVTPENATTTVTINDNYVDFEIAYAVSLQYGTEQTSVQKHAFTVPVQLGKLYKSAVQIMNTENKNYFVEERTLDAIYMYPEIPSTSINFECSPRIWTKASVETSLKNLIVNIIPFIKIKGTNYATSNKYFEMDTGSQDKSVRVGVIPLTEPFKFDVTPSDGELLKGEPMIGEGENEALDFIRSIFCISSYHFVYTVGYPIVFQLNDENGYLFQFPVQIMIANNQPKEDRLSGAGITITPELCANKLAKETVNTFTSDKNGNVIPLDNAELSYKCISTTCNIGNTAQSTITAQFPQCVNGLLIADKQGYHPAKYTMSTNFNEQEVSLILEKYINFTLNISVVDTNGKIKALNNGETVIVKMSNTEKGHDINAVYPSQTNINLLEGEYSVQLNLFQEGTFVLEGQKTTQCTNIPKGGVLGFLGFTEEKCIDFETPTTTLTQVFGGGAEFSVNITQGKILNMYLLKTNVPKTVDELNSAYQVSQTASSNSNFKQPEIK